jgi:pimeloyl-ACP methyl ester carboxylesterase
VTDFVLVHGGWHGAWCWAFLVDELAARGHRAVTVDLPAESPSAGAAACAEVVLAALQGETPPPAATTPEQWRTRREGVPPPGEDVVLVGHSLAGLTIPLVAAADRRIRHLVYLAAMLPDPGRSVADGGRQTVRGLGRGLVQHEDGSSSWRPAAAVEILYPDSPPQRAAWAAARLRRQHWRATTEVTPLAAWPDVPATYIRCADDAVIDADWARRAMPERLGVEPVTLPGDHCPFLSRPAELADLLTSL